MIAVVSRRVVGWVEGGTPEPSTNNVHPPRNPTGAGHTKRVLGFGASERLKNSLFDAPLPNLRNVRCRPHGWGFFALCAPLCARGLAAVWAFIWWEHILHNA